MDTISQVQPNLRPRREADVIEGCCPKRIRIMRAFKKPESCVGTYVQTLRHNLCPGHAIGGHIGSERGPNSRQLHPGVGERVCSTPDGPLKVVLHLKAPSSSSHFDLHIPT